MELLSGCNDIKKFRHIENICLLIGVLVSMVVSLPFIRPFLGTTLYNVLSHGWMFVAAAFGLYEGIALHKKLHIAVAVILILLGTWLMSF